MWTKAGMVSFLCHGEAGIMSALLSEPAPATIHSKRVPLWRSGIHALGTSIAAILLALVNSIVIARALGPAGKGSYDLALTTAALLGIALGFSLPVGVTYVVARGRTNLRALAWQLVGMAFILGAVAITILFMLLNTSLAKYFVPAHVGNRIVILVIVTTCLMETANYWRAILNGRQEIIQANRGDLISRTAHAVIALLALGILAIKSQQASPALFIIINIAVLILTNLLFLKTLSGALRPSPGPSGLGEVLAYAFPCYLGNFIQFLNYRLDVFIVNYFSGRDALGLYTLAVSLGQMIWLVSKAAATVLLPNVAALQEAAAANAQRTAQITRLAFVISLVSALLLGLFAAPLVPWIFGEDYRPSVAPLLWLLPGIVAFSAANVIASYLAGMGKPRLNLYVALAGLVVTIVLDLSLIPLFGIVGAAIASSLSYATSTVIVLWLFRRVSGLRVQQALVPTREDFVWGINLLRSMRQRQPLAGDR
jgi:O-antigen/teichoic acid export membrane protein